MRTVSLPGGIQTSALGFGCSALVGGRTRREAVQLLDAAFDAGIRHFDTARAYGTGDAELVLASVAARHRDEISIVTKFGIDPLRSAPPLDAAKQIVRMAARRSSLLVRALRRYGGRTTKRGRFSPEAARASLDASLRALAVDHVDVLLLHDCRAGDWRRPDLLETLDELVSVRRVRAFGTATTFEVTAAIFNGHGRLPTVAQFDDDVLTCNAARFAAIEHGAFVVTHGAFRVAFRPIERILARDAELAAEWSGRLGVDVSQHSVLADLLLAHSLAANPGGIVLFSSGDPGRIAANAALVAEPRYESAQLREFETLARGAFAAMSRH